MMAPHDDYGDVFQPTEDAISELLHDLNKKKISQYAAVIAFCAVVATLGVAGNIMTVVFYGFKVARIPTNLIMASLATIDLVTCIVLADEIIELCFTLTFKDVVGCKFMYFLNHWLVITSGTMLFFVAMDRYRKICRPLHWQFSMLSIKLSIAAIVGFGLAISVRDLIVLDVVRVNISADTPNTTVTAFYCTHSKDQGLQTTITVFHLLDLLTFAVDIGGLSILYLLVARALWKSQKRIKRGVHKQAILKLNDKDFKNEGIFVTCAPIVPCHVAGGNYFARCEVDDGFESCETMSNPATGHTELDSIALDLDKACDDEVNRVNRHMDNDMVADTNAAGNDYLSKSCSNGVTSSFQNTHNGGNNVTFGGGSIQNGDKGFTSDTRNIPIENIGSLEAKSNSSPVDADITFDGTGIDTDNAHIENNIGYSEMTSDRGTGFERDYDNLDHKNGRPSCLNFENSQLVVTKGVFTTDVSNEANKDHTGVPQSCDKSTNEADTSACSLNNNSETNTGTDNSVAFHQKWTEQIKPSKKDMTTKAQGKRHRSPTAGDLSDMRLERRITIMMIFITAASVISYVPYFVVNLGIKPYSSTTEQQFSVGIQIALRSYIINNAVNPYITIIFNSKFRQFVKQFFCGRCLE